MKDRPEEWKDKFLMITSLITPELKVDVRDQLVWSDRNGSNMVFSVRTANTDLNVQSPIVEWWKLIWKAKDMAEIKGNSFDLMSIIYELINAERNGRIFKDIYRNCDEVFKAIMDVVRNKLIGLKVKDSCAVRQIEGRWAILSTKLPTMVNSTGNSNLHNNTNQESNSQNMMNDPLHIASSDHPGMMLTNTLFNEGNFLGWSRTIKMALGAKLKLRFIDGYQRLSKIELEEIYGQSNGPLIYHVERELSKVSQGNSIVAAYFNKLKKFWDELHSLNGVPVCNCGKIRECTCGVNEIFLEIDSRSKLMQFLMRLNDDFEAVRNQILSIDTLLNLNKAYYIVQQVEKQKQVTYQVADPIAFFANNNVKGN
ncbi:NSP-interacting kinase 1-like protein [Tanacetum coccineum]|uniref:NSP-interacting kinase 1-like protein n=1 Tax=Tanacetum coccineum TaxID=301880 RepID=A0ABQ5H902_9ASTR